MSAAGRLQTLQRFPDAGLALVSGVRHAIRDETYKIKDLAIAQVRKGPRIVQPDHCLGPRVVTHPVARLHLLVVDIGSGQPVIADPARQACGEHSQQHHAGCNDYPPWHRQPVQYRPEA